MHIQLRMRGSVIGSMLHRGDFTKLTAEKACADSCASSPLPGQTVRVHEKHMN